MQIFKRQNGRERAETHECREGGQHYGIGRLKWKVSANLNMILNIWYRARKLKSIKEESKGDLEDFTAIQKRNFDEVLR